VSREFLGYLNYSNFIGQLQDFYKWGTFPTAKGTAVFLLRERVSNSEELEDHEDCVVDLWLSHLIASYSSIRCNNLQQVALSVLYVVCIQFAVEYWSIGDMQLSALLCS
jgi:hypothetical protein